MVTALASDLTGSFTLTFDGQTTAAIDANADESEVEAKLEALPNVGDVYVSHLSAGLGHLWTVTFVGDSASKITAE